MLSERLNLRDYGGYSAVNGAQIMTGRLYRSAELDRAENDALAGVEGLGLRRIIDFRNRHEVPATPTSQPPFSGLRIAAHDDQGVVPHAMERFLGLTRASEARAAMREVYRELICAPHFLRMTGSYLHSLADADGPTLVHCVAGKDRTGLAVALFQSLLEVEPEAIKREYLLTNAGGQARIEYLLSALSGHAAMSTLPQDVITEMCGVREEYLEAALAVISTQSDGTADYLRRHAGIDEDLITRLRRAYLVPHALKPNR
ncbi:tyrosine-protein phosphatase [Altererythrobacter sp. BO-6]|uniref:tyrosine-protein phosphatase n=1 Tax=Altererythrobacter sp. BO-6 TaxID=2604537 RepID=UPI0013E118FC|nr:tyrosine-protein phosphatase [Altererythrobacter sp. BO-6]QIG54729.1 tyrosine-protein phosphatase [Altererythrobacter sp. BO-6]